MIDLLHDLRTLAPFVRHRVLPLALPPAQPWEASVEDEEVGLVRLTGQLREAPGAQELVLVVHGLGGTPDSYYCRRCAHVAASFGLSSLAVALRGADRLGEDYYNIALRADLAAALASPALARYERVLVVGYSMGGYVTMHYARGPLDPRVKAVAAVCTPLDLLAAQRYIDTTRAWLYRQHVLNGLKSIYAAVAARGRRVPTDPADVLAVRTMYDWDRLAIAPRYGYEGPEHYYEALSIKPHIGDLAVPTLLVAGRADPIVPATTIEPFLHLREAGKGHRLDVRWGRNAGHVAFPRDFDLGFGPRLGLEAQIFQWALAQE